MKSAFLCNWISNLPLKSITHMNKKLLLPGSITALLFVASCTKQTVHKADIPTTGTPDTVVFTLPPKVVDTVTITDNNNMLLGNPTMATPDSTKESNYLINQTYYAESYSRSRGIPTWVSWHLQSEDIGGAGRQDDFRAYTSLPTGWYQVNESSYSGSGFDRGHNCPSGDRTSTQAANSTTFLMTNMIPQASKFNQGPWEGLEDFIRSSLVSTGNEAFIVMGSYGVGGLGAGKTDTARTLDNGHVTVPKKVWKVVVAISKGTGDLNRITANSTILAVNMPNIDNLYGTSSSGKTAWQNYLTSVNDLEAEAKANGVELDILRNINSAVKAALKSKVYKP